MATKDMKTWSVEGGDTYKITDEYARSEIKRISESNITGSTSIKLGVGLTLKDKVLSVDSATDLEGDNTRPASASLVDATLGNINALLKTI